MYHITTEMESGLFRGLERLILVDPKKIQNYGMFDLIRMEFTPHFIA